MSHPHWRRVRRPKLRGGREDFGDGDGRCVKRTSNNSPADVIAVERCVFGKFAPITPKARCGRGGVLRDTPERIQRRSVLIGAKCARERRQPRQVAIVSRPSSAAP